MLRLSRFSQRDLKRILLEVAWLPVGFGCWRADQHEYVILCYIKSNIPCYSVSSPPYVSLFCVWVNVVPLQGVLTYFLDLTWGSVCWSHCSWDKLYLCWKVKCHERDTQVLNIVCLDWSEYFWSDLHQILPVLKPIFPNKPCLQMPKIFWTRSYESLKALTYRGLFQHCKYLYVVEPGPVAHENGLHQSVNTALS